MMFFSKIKNRIAIWSKILPLGLSPGKLKTGSGTDIWTSMFIAALLTIGKRWEQPKGPLTDGWVSKMQHLHTMKYYSALKRKEILTHATTWMNLEDIMQSEISQSQRDKYYMIPLIRGT